MEKCSLKEWVATNEGWQDWLKKAWNWSPANQQTMGTYPSQYVDASGKQVPQAPNSALQPQQAARAMPQQQQAQQRKTVGFRVADMENLKASITEYLGLISRFMTAVHQHIPYPDFIRRAVNSFEKNVGPDYANLYKKVQWINDMNKLARSQYEWTNLFTEGIKINYKRFEEMVTAMRNLAMKMKYWVQAMMSKLPPQMAAAVNDEYSKIQRQQGLVGRQVQWLQGKLQQLMQANNINYGGGW